MSYSITTSKTWSATLNELEKEFSMWRIHDWDVNYPKGARSEKKYQSEEDRTVRLEFTKNKEKVVLQYGQQDRAVDNLRALYWTIHDMRMIEKRGTSDLVQSAYKQLGSGSNTFGTDINVATTKSPYEILGVREDANIEDIEAVYRNQARKYHPDSKPDGNEEMFKQTNRAIEEIRMQKM